MPEAFVYHLKGVYRSADATLVVTGRTFFLVIVIQSSFITLYNPIYLRAVAHTLYKLPLAQHFQITFKIPELIHRKKRLPD